MTVLVIATRNKGKIAEISRLLDVSGSDGESPYAGTNSSRSLEFGSLEFRSVGDFDLPDVEETGMTFEENALLKAETIARATGFAAIADDSGLSVDVLGGAPGIYSARYSGVHGDDEANIQRLLADLSAYGNDERGAEFIAVIALAKPDGSHILARGELRGRIAFEKRGVNGFGYDPIFIPEGDGRTLGEYTAAEKDEISHRAKALVEIAPKVPNFLFGPQLEIPDSITFRE